MIFSHLLAALQCCSAHMAPALNTTSTPQALAPLSVITYAAAKHSETHAAGAPRCQTDTAGCAADFRRLVHSEGQDIPRPTPSAVAKQTLARTRRPLTFGANLGRSTSRPPRRDRVNTCPATPSTRSPRRLTIHKIMDDDDKKIKKALQMLNAKDKHVLAQALRDPKEFATPRSLMEAFKDVGMRLVDLLLKSKGNADIFVEGLKEMGSKPVGTVHKSNCGGASPPRPNHDLNAIDATPARRRSGVDSSPLDGASTAASSSRNDLVKNYRVHATHWLISTQRSTGRR